MSRWMDAAECRLVAERSRMMLERGMIGRTYAGHVRQIKNRSRIN